MQMQAGIVHLLLSFGENPIHRNGSCEVGTISSILGAEVHQDEFAIFALLVIEYIVQCSGPVTTGDNTIVSRTCGTLAQEGMKNFSFDLVLHNAGFDKLQQATKSLLSDIDRFLYNFNFGR